MAVITATNLHLSTVGSPFVTCKDSHLAAYLGSTTDGVLGGVVGITVCNEVRYKGLDAAARMRSGREQRVRHKSQNS